MSAWFSLSGLPAPVPAAEPLQQKGQRSQDLASRATSYVCANCDRAFTPPARATAFCGLGCKGEARAVRYGRKLRREHGDELPEDHAYALKMQIAHALGGGYRATARRLSAAVRAEVIDRDSGVRQQCGEPGEEIDHIEGDSSDRTNLRYLCKPCRHEVTDRHLTRIMDGETLLRALNLRRRIGAAEPLRACDRPDWSSTWRGWASQHADYAGRCSSLPRTAHPFRGRISTSRCSSAARALLPTVRLISCVLWVGHPVGRSFAVRSRARKSRARH